MDGIVPLYFLPPDYTGIDTHALPSLRRTEKVEEENNASDDESEQENQVKTVMKKETPSQGKVNAFSLLDSSSEEEDSD